MKQPSFYIEKLSASIADTWRESFQEINGIYKPYFKTTHDSAWIREHKKDSVDLAHSDFDELPEDWKAENRASARIAISEIMNAHTQGQKLDKDFIESTAQKIHNAWRIRNNYRASIEQLNDFAHLSEEEKEKDREIVRRGIEIVR